MYERCLITEKNGVKIEQSMGELVYRDKVKNTPLQTVPPPGGTPGGD